VAVTEEVDWVGGLGAVDWEVEEAEMEGEG
jgi:hypothetical protein